MFIETHSADVVIHALAIRLAKQCRWTIQAVLRDEEHKDADMAFYEIIRAGLEELAASKQAKREV